jgi:epoxide hydrolase 4
LSAPDHVAPFCFLSELAISHRFLVTRASNSRRTGGLDAAPPSISLVEQEAETNRMQFRVFTVLTACSFTCTLGYEPAFAQAVGTDPVAPFVKTSPQLEDRFADNGGVKIHYIASGKGPLVVLVHGFADFSGTWSELIPRLTDFYRVAAVDLRGYNLSDIPDGQSAYTMPNLVGDIAAVIAAEGRSSATLIGHDWGAAIAWRFAFVRPEAVDALVVLSMPHPAAYARDLIINPDQSAAHRRTGALLASGLEQRPTQSALDPWLKDEATRKTHEAAMARSSVKAMLDHLRANQPFGSLSAGEDASAMAINLPVLIIHGVEDEVVLVSGHDHTWDYVSNDSAILRIPGAGHFVHHDRPDIVNGTVRSWLDLHQR